MALTIHSRLADIHSCAMILKQSSDNCCFYFNQCNEQAYDNLKYLTCGF